MKIQQQNGKRTKNEKRKCCVSVFQLNRLFCFLLSFIRYFHIFLWRIRYEKQRDIYYEEREFFIQNWKIEWKQLLVGENLVVCCLLALFRKYFCVTSKQMFDIFGHFYADLFTLWFNINSITVHWTFLTNQKFNF